MPNELTITDGQLMPRHVAQRVRDAASRRHVGGETVAVGDSRLPPRVAPGTNVRDHAADRHPVSGGWIVDDDVAVACRSARCRRRRAVVTLGNTPGARGARPTSYTRPGAGSDRQPAGRDVRARRRERRDRLGVALWPERGVRRRCRCEDVVGSRPRCRARAERRRASSTTSCGAPSRPWAERHREHRLDRRARRRLRELDPLDRGRPRDPRAAVDPSAGRR